MEPTPSRVDLAALHISSVGGKFTRGVSLPALYLTPHALHKVFCPAGPALHWGVLVAPQCTHLLATFAAVCGLDAISCTAAAALAAALTSAAVGVLGAIAWVCAWCVSSTAEDSHSACTWKDCRLGADAGRTGTSVPLSNPDARCVVALIVPGSSQLHHGCSFDPSCTVVSSREATWAALGSVSSSCSSQEHSHPALGSSSRCRKFLPPFHDLLLPKKSTLSSAKY